MVMAGNIIEQYENGAEASFLFGGEVSGCGFITAVNVTR